MLIRDKYIPAIFNHKNLIYLTIVALIDAVAQVTLGGIVRVTGSGLGCPDWPLCYGQVIPPFKLDTLIEYSHRLSGMMLGILVLLMCIGFVRSNNKHKSKLTTRLSILALVLVVAAGLLGGVTVLTELSKWMRLVHLGVAEILITCLCAIIVFELPAQKVIGVIRYKIIGQMVAFSVGITLFSILFGSYVVGSGYSAVCGTWPLCRGDFFPTDLFSFMHMAHRYLAIVLLVSFASFAYVSIVKFGLINRFSISVVGGLVILVAQIILGAIIIWTGFASEFKAMHLTMATLFWVAISIVASIYVKEYIKCA
jgi:heme A synthase